jgi:hypothetical protein
MKLRPFQEIGANWLASRKHAILGDRMGLGKSAQAIVAAHRAGFAPSGSRVLILAPLATAIGWQREIAKFWPEADKARWPTLHIIRRADPVPAAGWVFVPWTDLAVRLADLQGSGQFDLVIMDEVHRTKAGKASKVGAAAWGAWKKSDSGWALTPGAFDLAPRVWALSGTPMPNGRPIEMASMLQRMGVSCAKSRSKYVNRYCSQPNRFSPSGFDELGAKNLDELGEILAREIMLARSPEMVAGELPDLQRVQVELDCRAPKTDLQADVDNQGKVTFKSRTGLPAFDEMAKYRAELGLAKVAAVAAWVEDYCTDGGALSRENRRPLVVFTHHKDVARQIASALAAVEIPSIVATGDDQPEQRQAKVDEFAANEVGVPTVFIGTAPACGTGMNGLHRRTAVCAFAEGEWSPADLDQAEGRVRRIGGVATDMCLAHYLVVRDSLEAHITSLILEKRERIDEVSAAQTGRAIAPPAGPLVQVPVQELAAEALPDPTEVRWSWTQDKTSGDWLVRATHESGFAEPPTHPWIGATVTVTNRAGTATDVVLVRRKAGGIYHGEGWSVWSHAKPDAGLAKARNDARYLMRRGTARGIAGADAEAPLVGADLECAAVASAAAARLTGLDPDCAGKRNDVGWNKADGMMGRILANTPPEAWTSGLLTTARAMLRTYSRTQIADLWAEIAGK